MATPIVVITGAAQGIGAATARTFVKHDYDVRLLDINSSIASVAESLTQEGPGSATGYECDITNRDQVSAIAEQVAAAGEVRVLVNNAGWTPNERFIGQDPAVQDRIMGINLYGVFNTTTAYVPHMPSGSAIVNVASDAARVGVPKEAVYAAAKAGVIAFSKTMAVELGRSGVRVNVVSPGTTATPLVTEHLTPEQIERRVAANPMGRFGEPEEVAEVIRWLALDANYVNGQVLSINGGATRVG